MAFGKWSPPATTAKMLQILNMNFPCDRWIMQWHSRQESRNQITGENPTIYKFYVDSPVILRFDAVLTYHHFIEFVVSLMANLSATRLSTWAKNTHTFVNHSFILCIVFFLPSPLAIRSVLFFYSRALTTCSVCNMHVNSMCGRPHFGYMLNKMNIWWRPIWIIQNHGFWMWHTSMLASACAQKGSMHNVFVSH